MYTTRIVGVAIVPTCENGTWNGCRADFDGDAFGIGAATAYDAKISVVAEYRDGVLRRAILVEQCLIGGIACDGHIARVAHDAVAPTKEDVILIGCGS